MNFRFLIPVVILAAGVGGAVAVIKSKPPVQPIAIEEKAWLIETVSVARAAHHPTLVLFGRVETPRTAKLTAALTADVVSVHVREGERVKTGQLLISLDQREAELLVRQRIAEEAEIRALVDIENQQHQNNQESLGRELKVLSLSRRAVKRAEELANTNVGSKSQLDTARQEQEQRSMAVDARRTAIQGHASRIAQLEARLAKAQALRDRAQLDVDRASVAAHARALERDRDDRFGAHAHDRPLLDALHARDRLRPVLHEGAGAARIQAVHRHGHRDRLQRRVGRGVRARLGNQ